MHVRKSERFGLSLCSSDSKHLKPERRGLMPWRVSSTCLMIWIKRAPWAGINKRIIEITKPPHFLGRRRGNGWVKGDSDHDSRDCSGRATQGNQMFSETSAIAERLNNYLNECTACACNTSYNVVIFRVEVFPALCNDKLQFLKLRRMLAGMRCFWNSSCTKKRWNVFAFRNFVRQQKAALCWRRTKFRQTGKAAFRWNSQQQSAYSTLTRCAAQQWLLDMTNGETQV